MMSAWPTVTAASQRSSVEPCSTGPSVTVRTGLLNQLTEHIFNELQDASGMADSICSRK